MGVIPSNGLRRGEFAHCTSPGLRFMKVLQPQPEASLGNSVCSYERGMGAQELARQFFALRPLWCWRETSSWMGEMGAMTPRK